MLLFVKKALFSLVWDTKTSSVLGTGQVHEFYGLKASQMSTVRASSHEYPHVEKIKNLREQNSKVRQAISNWIVRILNKVTSVIISKLNSCVKYPDSFICFCCVQYC